MLLLGIALLLDGWVLRQMPADGTQFGDFYYLLRGLGYLPTWIAFCLLFTFAGEKKTLLARRNSALAIGFTAAGSGVLAALLEARHSGRGQVVDAAMVDGVASLMTAAYALRSAGITSDTRGANLLDSGAHFYDVFETSDAQYIAVAPMLTPP